MSKSIDDLLECLTIELKLGSKGNKLPAIVQRKPGTDIDVFVEEMESILCSQNNTNITVCGYFNIAA